MLNIFRKLRHKLNKPSPIQRGVESSLEQHILEINQYLKDLEGAESREYWGEIRELIKKRVGDYLDNYAPSATAHFRRFISERAFYSFERKVKALQSEYDFVFNT